MKKSPLLNAELSRVVARLGHTDSLAIADAGLPIPDSVERIDLALIRGLPSLIQVVEAITKEMMVEAAVMAKEMVAENPQVHQALLNYLKQLEEQQGNVISIDYLPHARFKSKTAECKAVVRSGECSPFANVILYAGVAF